MGEGRRGGMRYERRGIQERDELKVEVRRGEKRGVRAQEGVCMLGGTSTQKARLEKGEETKPQVQSVKTQVREAEKSECKRAKKDERREEREHSPLALLYSVWSAKGLSARGGDRSWLLTQH